MKNKLSDLNNHLFAALERISDEDLTEEQISREVDRAKAVAQLAVQVIASANCSLDAAKFLKASGSDYESTNAVLAIAGKSE